MYSASKDRYEKMKYRRCGRSGLLLPEVSFGLWQNFGLEKTLEEQKEILFAAFDAGITHFDLANNYGHPANGMAEENFGRVMRDEFRPYRDETVSYTHLDVYKRQVLTDLHVADPEWNVILLRYFNPVGAHESGRIGEDPTGIPNNLTPYITQVAVGKLKEVSVFGNDYDTPDGTGVRDYIHVMDLAVGHVKALKKFDDKPDVYIYNLGTGRGYSVLEMIRAFSKAVGHDIPYVIKPRRAGDIATCYADATKAKKELGWVAERDIDDMCRDAWRWQSQNPNGYRG